MSRFVFFLFLVILGNQKVISFFTIDCRNGQYKENGSCQQCLPGKFSYGGDVTSCTDCELGKYQSISGQSTCLNCAKQNVTEKLTAAEKCEACDDGFHPFVPYASLSTGIPNSCTQCDANEYAIYPYENWNSELEQSPCKTCPECKQLDCPAGSYQSSTIQEGCICQPNFFHYVGCQQCPSGKYRDATDNPYSCQSCPEHLVSITGSVSDKDCLCPPGQYMSDAETRTCAPAPLNTYVESANNGTDAVKMCPYNTYTMYDGSVKQTDCLCDDPKVCEICAMGQFFIEENVPNTNIQRYICHACPAGKFGQYPGMSVCTDCTPGTFSPNPGARMCSPCPQDHKSTNHGQSTCTECDHGTFSTPGSTTCNSCTAGTYYNGTHCANCTDGTFAQANGMTSCTPCPSAGYN